MMVPAALTQEEKETKQLFEQIKNERKLFEAALKKFGYAPGKLDQRQSKDSVDDNAEMNRKEVLNKLASGKITFEKTDEKQIFKRSKVARKESNPSETQRPSMDFGRMDPVSSFASNNLRSPTNASNRGYNLQENTPNSSFANFGQIKRYHVEERQRFVSAGFTPTSATSSEFAKPDPIERQTFKRKLPETDSIDREVVQYETEEGELFDDNNIE